MESVLQLALPLWIGLAAWSAATVRAPRRAVNDNQPRLARRLARRPASGYAARRWRGVAQLVRASVSKTEGPRFESELPCQRRCPQVGGVAGTQTGEAGRQVASASLSDVTGFAPVTTLASKTVAHVVNLQTASDP